MAKPLLALLSLSVLWLQACAGDPESIEGALRASDVSLATDLTTVGPIKLPPIKPTCQKLPAPVFPPGPPSLTQIGPKQYCPSYNLYPPRTVEIRAAHPHTDPAQHAAMLDKLAAAVSVPNTTVLIGTNVVLDFSNVCAEDLPLQVAACVTVTSVSKFPGDLTIGTAAFAGAPLPTFYDWRSYPGRTPELLGPVLSYGPHRTTGVTGVFVHVGCTEDRTYPSDNVRISGLRVWGPTFDQQEEDDIGINVDRCLNVEISNMEIGGFAGQAIRVGDRDPKGQEHGPGQEQPSNLPGDRIGPANPVRIFRNYIHHNQNPTDYVKWSFWDPERHAGGYGVQTDDGAWTRIYENVFDENRHAIEASGRAGGYEALRNLVLKGGGLHEVTFGIRTHQFDIHGTGDNGKGGQAGVTFLYAENAFQYDKDNAIYIRGTPKGSALIRDNIFPHEGFEDDWGDDAVKLEYRSDIGNTIFLGPNNTIDYDSYGRYKVCDFNGDGVDDLFLATGRTWWYSSMGKFQWTYLDAHTERPEQLRVGYFDDDNRCDVLTESGGEWKIVSGGTGPWTSLGSTEGAPLAEVEFGRFDPSQRDHRAGATKRTTHAFWRTPQGEWKVTPLVNPPAPRWTKIGSSGFAMSKLRFGDFTGDGVTDVLAVENGRWAISESGRYKWAPLNPSIGDDVASLLIADLNNDNIDDLIKVERTSFTVNYDTVNTVTWWVSDNGRSPWRKLKSYEFRHFTASPPLPVKTFTGRFGGMPGGDLLLVDPYRKGRFYSEAELARGFPPDWTAQFAY